MDALVTAIPLSSVGPVAIAALAVLAVIQGALVPRKTHEQIVELLTTALEIERRAHERVQAALSVLLTEHGTTTDRVLNSLPVPPAEGGEKDGT